MGLAERNPELAAAALLVRRTSLRVDPARVAELAGLSRDEAVAAVLSTPFDDAGAPVAEKSNVTLEWWLDRIGQNVNGLQERMAFFWHSVIPTHRYAVGEQQLVGIQLNTLRAKALTNFRDLLQSMMVDPAMLKYLDAVNSRADKPNENLAREIMELFTIGVDAGYTEDDVRNAALAMAGWRVDKDSHQAYLEPKRVYDGETSFLGETKRWDIPSIVDRLCDHPATAARIGARVWYHFTGKTLSGDARSELGAWWQARNLDVMPLMERILLDEQFWADHYARPRSGFEYYTAVQRLLAFEPKDLWRPRSLGQLPYEPPNVGGWPEGNRWLTADSMLRRSEQLFSLDFRKIPNGTSATMEEILDQAGLYVVNEDVVAAMNRVVDHVDKLGQESIPQLQWRIALSSPEFQLQ